MGEDLHNFLPDLKAFLIYIIQQHNIYNSTYIVHNIVAVLHPPDKYLEELLNLLISTSFIFAHLVITEKLISVFSIHWIVFKLSKTLRISLGKLLPHYKVVLWFTVVVFFFPIIFINLKIILMLILALLWDKFNLVQQKVQLDKKAELPFLFSVLFF